MFGIGSILTSILTFLIEKFGTSAIKFSISFAYKTASWALIISIYYFIFSGFNTLYTLVNQTITNFTTLTSGASSCISQSISYSLGCIGVIDALNTTLPFFFSALVFLIMVYSKNIILRIRSKFDKDVNDLIDKL